MKWNKEISNMYFYGVHMGTAQDNFSDCLYFNIY